MIDRVVGDIPGSVGGLVEARIVDVEDVSASTA